MSQNQPVRSPAGSRSVAGRVVIVTGAASGIGKATVEAFRNEGALVAGLDVTFSADSPESSSDHVELACDVSNDAAVTSAVDTVRNQLGPIDILVNNAGVSLPTPIADPNFEDGWLRSLDINLTAQTRMIRACLDDLLRLGDGRIVNIASTEGLGGTANISGYTASKHGVVGLTRSLAVELGKSGVTVNAVCPGPINTGMTQEIADDHKAIFSRRFTALRRYGDPHEVADLIVSISLPSASYLTGAIIPVDGGMIARNQ